MDLTSDTAACLAYSCTKSLLTAFVQTLLEVLFSCKSAQEHVVPQPNAVIDED